MVFEDLINQPHDEFELFMMVCKIIQRNFSHYEGNYYVLHLESHNDRKMALKRIATFDNESEVGNYYFDSYAAEPCICTRNDGDSIALMLIGQYYTAFYNVTSDRIIEESKGNYSKIPSKKELYKKMSAQQVRAAFADIGGQLKRSGRKKAV
jgi:hypothetical protein